MKRGYSINCNPIYIITTPALEAGALPGCVTSRGGFFVAPARSMCQGETGGCGGGLDGGRWQGGMGVAVLAVFRELEIVLTVVHFGWYFSLHCEHRFLLSLFEMPSLLD